MKSDHFVPVSASMLMKILLKEFSEKQQFLGIPKQLFYTPELNNPLKTRVFAAEIDNPLGVAAGPHTQMAQNIVAAWLCGARYIELKTIQSLDQLEISKPCIDMQDEGYNCEWSQELLVEQSFEEYLKAWVIIHVLHHYLGRSGKPGLIFNMSAGYHYEGILQPNVQWFLEKMKSCREDVLRIQHEISEIYPDAQKIKIPFGLSNNITLSTMHGCPAGEIETIAAYLLENKKLHTYIKLNPTLLGPEMLRHILNTQLGFKTTVPDEAFEHDLKYPDALRIIQSLSQKASENGLEFGIKLSNTLESVNTKNVFDKSVENMYLSGRALHPLTVNLAARLRNDLGAELSVSFSGGADAFNIADLLACGFVSITMCSDLLKPGGYMRLQQYFSNLRKDFHDIEAHSVLDFICKKSMVETTVGKAAMATLSRYANEVLNNSAYQRNYIKTPDIKGSRSLHHFDCIAAPCIQSCATHQDIPVYLHQAASGDFAASIRTILETNPFPSVTGMVCDHLCQSKCTRIHYDEAIKIREVKRFVSEQELIHPLQMPTNSFTVAIIGAGPAGLSAAYYLALAGSKVTVFEKNSKAGGMVQFAIPGFRLTEEAFQKDLDRVEALGVDIRYNQTVDAAIFAKLRTEYHAVMLAAGAQLSAPFSIRGLDAEGVLDSLEFLFNAKAAFPTGAGNNIIIIGGGNTAMDAARTAWRLNAPHGKVTVVYRRTIDEMPADQGEINAVLEEGIQIVELAAPLEVYQQNGRVAGLLVNRMRLGAPDANGRPKPMPVEGDTYLLACDTLIPAVGQATDFGFISESSLPKPDGSLKTSLPGVYAGGDAVRGASTAIKAIADGRKAAAEMLNDARQKGLIPASKAKTHSHEELMIRRATRVFGQKPHELPASERRNFSLVSQSFTQNEVVHEASRCLHCDELCNICTTVCPNFANYSYFVEPASYPVYNFQRDLDGRTVASQSGLFTITQAPQILNLANFCNECGNCNTFCPTNSAPYLKKPRLHLNRLSFDQSELGYYAEKDDNSLCLYFKSGDYNCRLLQSAFGYHFRDHQLAFDLDFPSAEVSNAELYSTDTASSGTAKALEMIHILRGAVGLLG